MPNFEVEPIADCADAISLLAVAAELGHRSRLEVFLHPTLFDAQPAAESAQRVPATAHTDDGNVVVAFDATPFFETLADDLIRDLIEDDFAGGYGADAVAQELADETNELGRMFWYLELTNGVTNSLAMKSPLIGTLPNAGSSFIDHTCWSKKRPEGGRREPYP